MSRLPHADEMPRTFCLDCGDPVILAGKCDNCRDEARRAFDEMFPDEECPEEVYDEGDEDDDADGANCDEDEG
jgi:hypothetical protein